MPDKEMTVGKINFGNTGKQVTVRPRGTFAAVSVSSTNWVGEPALLEARLRELLKWLEAGRPSNYAPWRDCDIAEMLKILRGEGSPNVKSELPAP